MASRETLECRIYMAEDAMYRRSSELDRQLHELESRLKELTAAIHRVLCESGQTPLQVKSGSIVRAVEVFEASVDLGDIRAKAERVTSLKGLIGDYERELEDSSWMPGASPDDYLAREVFATAR
jgi:hypothetical protein